MEDKNLEVEKLLKRLRVALVLGIVFVIITIVISWFSGVNIYLAITSAFLPIFLILFLFGQELEKKIGTPKVIFLKPEITKKRIFLVIFLFIIGLIFIFIHPYLSAIFFLIIVLLLGSKPKLDWIFKDLKKGQ